MKNRSGKSPLDIAAFKQYTHCLHAQLVTTWWEKRPLETLRERDKETESQLKRKLESGSKKQLFNILEKQ